MEFAVGSPTAETHLPQITDYARCTWLACRLETEKKVSVPGSRSDSLYCAGIFCLVHRWGCPFPSFKIVIPQSYLHRLQAQSASAYLISQVRYPFFLVTEISMRNAATPTTPPGRSSCGPAGGCRAWEPQPSQPTGASKEGWGATNPRQIDHDGAMMEL